MNDRLLSLLWALLWASGLTAAVGWHFISNGWPFDEAFLKAIFPYFIGGLLGGWLTMRLASKKMTTATMAVRFSFFFVCLTILTIGITSAYFVIQNLISFSQSHAEAGSLLRILQIFFTGLGSLYLMAITGLRPLLPWGLMLLFLASLAFSRGWLSTSR